MRSSYDLPPPEPTASPHLNQMMLQVAQPPCYPAACHPQVPQPASPHLNQMMSQVARVTVLPLISLQSKHSLVNGCEPSSSHLRHTTGRGGGMQG